MKVLNSCSYSTPNAEDLDFGIRKADILAAHLAASGVAPGSREDFRQDLLLDLFRRLPRFDPTRGSWRGFVDGVVRNHAAVLANRARRHPPEIFSEDLRNREDASDMDLLDILDTRLHSGLADAVHLRLDVRRVVDNLPTRLQLLAVLLGQMPVQDVCRHTGKSRSRVYQITRQLRAAFVAAGIVRHSPRKSRRKPKNNREPRQ